MLKKHMDEGIKATQTDMSERDQKIDWLTAADFQFNDALTEIVQCPAGQLPVARALSSRRVTARFNYAICKQCLKWLSCPTIHKEDTITIQFQKKQVFDAKRQNAGGKMK